MPSVFEPNSITSSIAGLVFYVIMAGFAFYSFLALYSLIRYGLSKVLSLVISIVYLIVILSFYANAAVTFNKINF